MSESPPSAAELRAAFDADREETVGIEEEVMVLDPESLDLVPRADAVLERLGGDGRFKPELPRAQLEILTGPAGTVGGAAAQLAQARADALSAADGLARFAAAGTHPFAAAEGELGAAERYLHTRERFGAIAHRQLVFGLHVHVALRGADRALAVYNGLRSHLPELAALAACAPFHAGADTGLASARPHISAMLPRQGVPPALESYDAYAQALAWAVDSGAARSVRSWWWELRLHPYLGTLEVRVPDAQATVDETAAVAAVTHCLVMSLASRHDAGEPLPAEPSWRIAENRWSACRYGLGGEMADLRTGEPQPTAQRVARLLDSLGGQAESLGCAAELASARALLDDPAPARHRAVVAESGVSGLARWLAGRFSGAGASVT